MVEDISDYRIDYLRIRLPWEIEPKLKAQGYYEKLINDICDKRGLKHDCYDFGQYRDTKLKQFIPYIEVWGWASEAVWQTLSGYEISQCTRIDTRCYLNDENVNFGLMHIFALNHNKANGTTRRIDSPFRNKLGGRDVGGTSIILGGEDSDIRLCTYRRGHEEPAHELQLKGRPLYNLVQVALLGDVGDYGAPRDNVMEALVLKLLDVTEDKYGISLAAIERGEFPKQIVMDGPVAEETLQQIDWLFGTLPALAQEAFLEDKIANLAEELDTTTPIAYATSNDAPDAYSDIF